MQMQFGFQLDRESVPVEFDTVTSRVQRINDNISVQGFNDPLYLVGKI